MRESPLDCAFTCVELNALAEMRTAATTAPEHAILSQTFFVIRLSISPRTDWEPRGVILPGKIPPRSCKCLFNMALGKPNGSRRAAGCGGGWIVHRVGALSMNFREGAQISRRVSCALPELGAPGVVVTRPGAILTEGQDRRVGCVNGVACASGLCTGRESRNIRSAPREPRKA